VWVVSAGVFFFFVWGLVFGVVFFVVWVVGVGWVWFFVLLFFWPDLFCVLVKPFFLS